MNKLESFLKALTSRYVNDANFEIYCNGKLMYLYGYKLKNGSYGRGAKCDSVDNIVEIQLESSRAPLEHNCKYIIVIEELVAALNDWDSGDTLRVKRKAFDDVLNIQFMEVRRQILTADEL